MPTLDPILHSLSLMAPAGYFIGLHIRYASPLMQFSNYNQDWLDHYTEKAYALRDPTIAWGFSKEGACRWSEIDVPDPFNPRDNLDGSARYLKSLLASFRGDLDLSIAAYNAGPGNADEWGGSSMTIEDITFPETEAYVKKVLEKQREYKHEYALELGY